MKVKWVMSLAFLMVFGAGAVIGMVPSHVGAPRSHSGRTSLSEELKLSEAQREQMRAIWSEMAGASDHGRSHWDKRRELQKQRDEEVRAMLSEEQKSKLDALYRKYDDKTAEMSRERSKAFADAVEKTKAILNDEQRQKYEAILKKRSEGGGRGWGSERDGATRPSLEARS